MSTALTLLTLELAVLEAVALVLWEHVRHTRLRTVAQHGRRHRP